MMTARVPARTGVRRRTRNRTRMVDGGAVSMSSALIDDEVWLRPCFVNFRTTEEDVLDLVEIAAEIGVRLASG